MVSVTIELSPALREWSASLTATEQQLSIAATRALNKTARWSKTQVARQTAEALSVPVTPVKDGLLIIRANRQRLQSTVGLAKSAGVIKASSLGSMTQTRRGTRAGKRSFDHAFIATMPSGHRGVFRRKGSQRLPLQEVQIVITRQIKKTLETLAEGTAMKHFERLFERELRYVMRSA